MDLPLNSKGSNQIQKIQIQFKRFKFNSKYSNSIQKIQFKSFNLFFFSSPKCQCCCYANALTTRGFVKYRFWDTRIY